MPWTTPTLRETRRLTRDYVLSQLGARAMIPNSVLRIMSDTMAGLCHLVLLYIDWLSKQLLPDTAEQEWLDRHGKIWLKNADGSTGRKAATYASGTIEFTGIYLTVIPTGTVLTGASMVQYQTTANGQVGASGQGWAPAAALTAGVIGNMLAGDALDLANAVVGLTDAVCYDDMTGGIDEESDDQLRERILFRIQKPPMGGDADDYVAWAFAVPGVTRAWAVSEMGIGTVTVRFMMDDLRAATGGFPNADDIAAVTTYIDSQRPVSVKDRFILAPVPEPIDFEINNLEIDSDAARDAIEISVREMLLKRAAPAHTINGVPQPAQMIYAAWVSEAILQAANVKSFTLAMTDHEMPSNGSLAVLGSIIYDLS